MLQCSPEKWTMPIMDDAASKQVRSNLDLQASNLCSLPKPFSFTHFRKNASANPFVSHTFKTKDLKPFRFTHFQKRGRGRVALVAQASACVGTRPCPSSSPGDFACFGKLSALSPSNIHTYGKCVR